MTEDRISAPVTRVDTQRDRPSDTSHYRAIERARDGGRRHPRHGQPPQTAAPSRPAPAPQAAPPSRSAADAVRGTHVDVLA